MPVVCRAFHDVRRINFFSEAGGVYFAVKLNSHENKNKEPKNITRTARVQ